MTKIIMVAAALFFPACAMAQAEGTGDLSDAQIAHVAVTANNGDIENGKLAKKKASNKEVRAYAVHMIKDHTNLNKESKALAAKLKITPEDNVVSKDLEADSQGALDKLTNLSGKEFDESYINAEVKLHQKVIEVADTKLAPNAKNAELKAMLAKARPILVSHLEHAKKIQESISKDKR
jgi:putative membrane protein